MAKYTGDALTAKTYDPTAGTNMVADYWSKRKAKSKGDTVATAGGTQPTTLGGAESRGYDPAYGGVPEVPNPYATQQQSIAANLANYGNLEELTNAINKLNLGFANQQNLLGQQQAQYNMGLGQQQANWYDALNKQIQGMNNAQQFDYALRQQAANQQLAQWQQMQNLGFAGQQNQLYQQMAEQNQARALEAARQADLMNMQMVNAQYAGHVPGLSGLEQQSSANIEAGLRGELNQDVINQIAQRAAERGIGTGISGSPSANAALLGALGQTSQQRQAQAEQELTAAMGRVPNVPLTNVPIAQAPYPDIASPQVSQMNLQYQGAPFYQPPNVQAPYSQASPFDPSSFLVSPGQGWDAQWLANTLAGAPIPRDAAAAELARVKEGMRAGNVPATTYSFPNPGGGGAPTVAGGPGQMQQRWYPSSGTGMYYGGQLYNQPPKGNTVAGPQVMGGPGTGGGSNVSNWQGLLGWLTGQQPGQMPYGGTLGWGYQPTSQGTMWMAPPTGGQAGGNLANDVQDMGAPPMTPQESEYWFPNMTSDEMSYYFGAPQPSGPGEGYASPIDQWLSPGYM